MLQLGVRQITECVALCSMAETLVCTIVTKSYLAYARALAVSLAEHNPGLELYVLLADRNDGEFDPDQEPFHLIPLEALSDQAAIQRMCFYYTPFELCCALRGLLHEYILSHTTAERWIFLDSDIYVCGSLEPVFERLRSATILLTPHTQTPASIEQADVCEINNLLRCGLYNAGFLGLRRCETTRQFVAWWQARLEHFCFNDLDNQDVRALYVDQLWLNIVPVYFPEVAFLEDLGCNLGHWNLWARPLTLSEDGSILAAGQPLRFVHFSGWCVDEPDRVSQNSPLYDQMEYLHWSHLGRAYRSLLIAQGHEALRHQSYAFSTFTNGELITPEMRLLYYEDWKKGLTEDLLPFEHPEVFRNRSLSRATVPRLQIQLEEVSTWASYVESQFQKLEGELTASQRRCRQLEVEIGILTKSRQLRAELGASQRRCQQLEAEMDTLTRNCQQLEVEVDTLTKHCQQSEAEIDTLTKHCQQLEAEIEILRNKPQLEGELDECQRQCQRLEAEVYILKNSRSMRMTAPFRCVWRGMRAGLRKLAQGLVLLRSLSKRLLKKILRCSIRALKAVPGFPKLKKYVLRRFPKLGAKLRRLMSGAFSPVVQSAPIMPAEIPAELSNLTATARSVYIELQRAIEKRHKD